MPDQAPVHTLHRSSAAKPTKISNETLNRTTLSEGSPQRNSIRLTESWDVTQIPFLPEFKRQTLLPIQEIIKNDMNTVLVDDSELCVRSKVFVLLDICTSNVGSSSDEVNSEQTNWELLPSTTNVDSLNGQTVQTVTISTKPCFRLSVDSNNSSNTVAQSGAEKAERKARTAATIQAEVSEYLQRAMTALNWQGDIPPVSGHLLTDIFCVYFVPHFIFLSC